MEIGKLNASLFNSYNGISESLSNTKGKDTETKLNAKDSLELTNKSRMKMPRVGGIDKGTAANTTIYVSKGTLNKILAYTHENPECKWEEMGWDGEKQWVVIDGQRFEYPLSEAEKEQYRKGTMTLLDYIEEEEKRKEELEGNEDKQPVKMPLAENDSLQDHPKIKGLQENTKVMTMLTELSKTPGGISLFL